MKTFITVICLFFAHKAICQKTTITDKRLAGIEAELNKVLQASKASSFAVAIVEKNKLVYAKGFGLRNREKQLPADENTLYAIGSCTKAFTSALIGLLQSDGKVDIDKPVRNYLPELKFYNNELNDNVTLRDMMSHRTGLPRHDISWYLFPTENRDSLLQRIQYMEPTFGVREKWQYNNFMFFAQGKLEEKISGKSWEDNIREKFFVPLGMKSSNMPYASVKNEINLAEGYDLKKDSSIKRLDQYNIGGMGPAGAIYSSVSDMANWVITWINGGKFNGKEIIPASFVREAIAAQMVTGPGLPDIEKPDLMFSTYGFGWFGSSYKSHYRVEHGGNIDGFSANTSFFPLDSIGIIILSNQNGSWVPAIARNIIADRMLKLPYFDWNADQVKKIIKGKKSEEEGKKAGGSEQRKAAKSTHEMKAYEGLYNHPAYGTMELVSEHDSLFAYCPAKKIWLEHYHYDVYAPYILETNEKIDTSERSDIRFVFNTAASGDIESIKIDNIEAPALNIIFKKIPKPKALTKEELNIYTGNYELAGTTINVTLKGDVLFAIVPGQPEYELVPLQEKDKFSLKILAGYFIHFERNDKNEIIAASFIQPNGTFKATKKK
jgi:CubicO group peptidase (beta-lactamase class C family)